MWNGHGSKGWAHFSSLSNQGNGAIYRSRRQLAWTFSVGGTMVSLIFTMRFQTGSTHCFAAVFQGVQISLVLHFIFICLHSVYILVPPSWPPILPPWTMLSGISTFSFFSSLPCHNKFGCHLKCYRSLQLSPVWSVLTFYRGQELVLASFSIISKNWKAL